MDRWVAVSFVIAVEFELMEAGTGVDDSFATQVELTTNEEFASRLVSLDVWLVTETGHTVVEVELMIDEEFALGLVMSTTEFSLDVLVAVAGDAVVEENSADDVPFEKDLTLEGAFETGLTSGRDTVTFEAVIDAFETG